MTYYSEAIKLEPTNATYYSNRASAHVMLLNFKESISDCNQALQLDPSNIKTYLKKLNALKGLGNLRESFSVCQKIIELSEIEATPVSPSILTDKKKFESAVMSIEIVKQLLLNKKYSLAISQVNQICESIGQNYIEVNIVKAYALLLNKRMEEAYNLSNSIVSFSFFRISISI